MLILPVIMICNLAILTFASASQNTLTNSMSYAQNSTTSSSTAPTQSSQPGQAGSSNLLVTKTIRCESNMGIPSDAAVCQFVLENVVPSQFTITVTGTNSPPTTIQGSINGTNVSVGQGNYTVSEDTLDTTDIENQLGETATVTISTASTGNCIPQYVNMDVFENATGTITDNSPQRCDLINTIEVTAGDAPEEFQQG
ncbi:MAG: hypothetical protein M3162_01080 [Thermoproteota archaeon]|nr:hypothetical protein [Thermoproteota archaeon]